MGGLSNDPDKRQRQLDALDQGRRTQAERLLARTSPGTSPSPGKAPAAAPAQPPKPARARAAQPRQGTYDRKPASPRKPRQRAAQPKPKPEPERPTGGLRAFLEGFTGG